MNVSRCGLHRHEPPQSTTTEGERRGLAAGEAGGRSAHHSLSITFSPLGFYKVILAHDAGGQDGLRRSSPHRHVQPHKHTPSHRQEELRFLLQSRTKRLRGAHFCKMRRRGARASFPPPQPKKKRRGGGGAANAPNWINRLAADGVSCLMTLKHSVAPLLSSSFTSSPLHLCAWKDADADGADRSERTRPSRRNTNQGRISPPPKKNPQTE